MTRAFKQRFPAGWRATSLGDELPLAYGKGLPAKSRDATGTFPVYGSAGVAGHHSESLVDGPALIVGRKGNVGMAHLVAGPSWPIDTTYFATFRSDQAPKFFKYLLDYLDLRSLDKSTAIPSL
ncbi:MAG: restriction endonuclease subunit S, partial [Deltaproteobacteria bacterium]|nr:restriction endonuclease subunit S [Deltaproteobacteria bacterium]